MSDHELEIQRLLGEIELLKQAHADEVEWWAKEQDFWRRKYLQDHPENDNWDFVESAREIEEDDKSW